MLNPLDASFPLALQVVDPARIIEADVRDDLRNGREPFQRIMSARAEVPDWGAFVVRATFEPAPLYRVMGKAGWAHHTECLAPDDWRVWFYRDLPVLDVRDMDPPEPLAHTMNAATVLPEGGALVQLNVRVPQFLLPKLTEQGLVFHVHEASPDRVHVLIQRPVRNVSSSTAPADTPTELNQEHHSMSDLKTLDVRVIPPREKHPTIFQTFNALGPGESFVLLNDHDPRPLRYQFEAEHSGQFGWAYLEQGPDIWRVQISRVAS